MSLVDPMLWGSQAMEKEVNMLKINWLAVYTADHGGYKFIAYVLTILPHILSLQNNS
jgi:hypothetical protein